MREIKFRGKRIDTGEWVYGYYYQDRTREKHYVICGQLVRPGGELPIPNFDYYEVDPETVGQYTGLRDENGKAIREGDIVLISDTYTALVEYSEERAAFAFTCKNRPMCADFLEVYYEVIGNADDNPELIKEVF